MRAIPASAASSALPPRGSSIGLREPGGVGADLLGLGEILGHRPAQLEHGADHRVEVLVEVGQRGVRRPGHHGAGELPRAGVAEDGAVGLAPDQHRVVAEDRVGERVVGRDLGRLERVVVVGDQPLLGQLADALADAGEQLPRGLARERQPEDLARPHLLVGEQPEHPVGHGLRLAAAGARDDERGRQIGLDDGDLLRGRRVELEGLRDLDGVSHWTPP